MKTVITSDLKLYFLNGISLILSFSSIDMILKIVLLLSSIGYTLDRWYRLRKTKDNEKDK
jgi:hypothetical protein